jgi:hypothetical protein
VHQPVILDPPAALRDWRPVLPEGDLRAIWLHWTGHRYDQVFPAYHFNISGARDVVVHHTHDLRENMRDVARDPDLPYAPHTRGRNAWAIGVSIAAMQDATPSDFGPCPLTEEQLGAMCEVAARLAAFYHIPVEAIRTHAEAALEDGYFGAGGEEQRWDIARLRASDEPLVPRDATTTGDWFRSRIAALLARPR